MKARTQTLISRLTAGVLLCAAVFIFTACENFLTGDQIKDQIESEIAYNNAKDVNIFISCKEEIGSVFPQQSYKVKVGYEFELQFIPKGENYIMKDSATIFEAVSRINPEESRADCVVFKAVEQSFQDKQNGLYRVKVKVTKNVDDIMIQPACLLRPMVLSMTPEPGTKSYEANTTIIVKFSTPLTDENGESISIPYGKDGIEIKYGSLEINSYFETPIVIDDKVIIQPKGNELAAFIESRTVIDISVSFSESIKIFQNGTDLNLAKNEKSSFMLQYNSSIEKKAPEFQKLFASRTTVQTSELSSFDPENSFLIQELDAFDTAEEVLTNRNNGTFCIFGNAYDADSGIRRIEVIEQRIRDNYGETTRDTPEKTKVYTRDNADFITDENGNTYFSIPFVSKSENGAIQLTVTLYDGCSNSATRKFVVFKKSFNDKALESTAFNTYPDVGISNGFLFDKVYECPDEATMKDWLKRIHYAPQESFVRLYKLEDNTKVFIPLSDYTVNCVLNSNSQSLDFEHYTENDVDEYYAIRNKLTKDYIGYFDLPVDKVSGVSFTITISDSIGNRAQKSFKIFDASDIDYSILPYTHTSDYSVQYFSKSNPDKYRAAAAAFIKYVSAVPVGIQRYDIYANVNYKMVPLLDGFYTDFSDFDIYLDPFTQEEVIASATCPFPTELTEDGLARLTVNVSLLQNKTFDYIYLSYYIGSNSQTNYIFFPANQLSHSFTIDPSLINKDYLNLQIYAVKDEKTSKNYTLKLNENRVYYSYLDRKAPSIRDPSRVNYNSVIFNCSDDSGNCSGEIEFHSTGHKVPLVNGYNYIPITEFSTGDNYYTLTLSDGSNNVLNKIDNFTIDPTNISKIARIDYYSAALPGVYANMTGWIMDSMEHAETFPYLFMHGEFSEFDSSEKEWSSISPSGSDNHYLDAEKDVDGVSHFYIQIKNPRISATYGKFIKMLTYHQMTTYDEKSYWPTPFYFYADATKQNSGNYDYIQTKSASEFFILSDAPTLIQTIVTDFSYEDCKSWTAYDWLVHPNIVDEYQWDFTDEGYPTPVRYDLSRNVLGKIKKNQCYCVVAHFADGTSYRSDVFQK